jgi:hypothetical protein
MPADLFPNAEIPGLAAKIDSPAILEILARLEEEGFMFNSPNLDQETAAILQQLANQGLADPGYTGPTTGPPYLWTRNSNGSRALRYALQSKLMINPRARTGLSSLSEKDQLAVLQTAVALRNCEPSSWPKGKAIRLDEHEPVYLLRVTPDLRAFIHILDSGEIELFDIVRKEALQLFR